MTPTEREGMLQVISDLSKEARGYRVRLPYHTMTDEELQSTWDGYVVESEYATQQESRVKLAAQREWETHMIAAIKMGARDFGTAVRWHMSTFDQDFRSDVGYYCYLNGLSYELEGRIRRYVS